MATEQDALSEVLEQLKRAARSAVELRILTVSGAVTESMDGDRVTWTPAADAKVVSSVINLAQGDIVNACDPSYFDEDGAQLRAFHDAQVALGRRIVADNLAALSACVRELRDVAAPRT